MSHLEGNRASLVAQLVKNLPAMQETWVCFLGQEDPLEKGMATHCSTLAWRIPWTEDLVCYSPWDRKESDTMQLTFLSFSWKETPEATLWISLLSSGCFNVFVDNLGLDLEGMLVTFYRRHTTGRFHGSMREMSQNCLGRLVKAKVFVIQSCPTLCNSMDWSPPGSSVHGIL